MSAAKLDTRQLLNQSGDCHYANGEDLHKAERDTLAHEAKKKLRSQTRVINGETVPDKELRRDRGQGSQLGSYLHVPRQS